jgi:hypothetical protein
VKDRLGLVELIVYPGLGSDEKLKLTTKLDEVFQFYLEITLCINIFENQINLKKAYQLQ